MLTITSGRGVVLNDVGLTPDVAVDLSDDDLLGGVDAQLESGIRNLRLPPRAIDVSWIVGPPDFGPVELEVAA